MISLLLGLLLRNRLLVQLSEDESGHPVVDIYSGELDEVHHWLNRHGDTVAVLVGSGQERDPRRDVPATATAQGQSPLA